MPWSRPYNLGQVTDWLIANGQTRWHAGSRPAIRTEILNDQANHTFATEFWIAPAPVTDRVEVTYPTVDRADHPPPDPADSPGHRQHRLCLRVSLGLLTLHPGQRRGLAAPARLGRGPRRRPLLRRHLVHATLPTPSPGHSRATAAASSSSSSRAPSPPMRKSQASSDDSTPSPRSTASATSHAPTATTNQSPRIGPFFTPATNRSRRDR